MLSSPHVADRSDNLAGKVAENDLSPPTCLGPRWTGCEGRGRPRCRSRPRTLPRGPSRPTSRTRRRSPGEARRWDHPGRRRRGAAGRRVLLRRRPPRGPNPNRTGIRHSSPAPASLPRRRARDPDRPQSTRSRSKSRSAARRRPSTRSPHCSSSEPGRVGHTRSQQRECPCRIGDRGSAGEWVGCCPQGRALGW
jgi:hypothetical protein